MPPSCIYLETGSAEIFISESLARSYQFLWYREMIRDDTFPEAVNPGLGKEEQSKGFREKILPSNEESQGKP